MCSPQFSADSLSDPMIRMAPDVLSAEEEVKFDSSAFQTFARNIARRLRDETGSYRSNSDIEEDIVKIIDFAENLDGGGVSFPRCKRSVFDP